MNRRSPLSPRQLLICVAIIFFCTVMVILCFGRKKDEKKFSEISRTLFVEEMTANTLNMHYTLANPETFGIESYEPILPPYSADTQEATLTSLQETLDELQAIQLGHLSAQDAYAYNLLVRLLKNSQKIKSFSYYQEPLSPASGIQSQLPILLAEYAFRSERDVQDYLALLDQIDTYFASLLAYEQEKAAAGLSMSRSSLKQVRKQCDTIVTKQSLSEGSHFLQTTFEERIKELHENQIISSKNVEKYIAQNNRLLRTVVQPAYEALADGLFLMEDSEEIEPLPSGLAARPQGKEYYLALLISETGSYRSLDDIQKLLSRTLKEEYSSIRSLVQENPSLTECLATGNYRHLPYHTPEQMLADLQVRLKKDFPKLVDSPTVTVKPVSENLADYCAPAFYLTAALDDTDSNVIYINEKNSTSELELYTTLAHEGYPGHLYQTVYSNRNFMAQQENPVRQLLWYGGYLEGWALYVEFYGYSYAAQLLQEQGRNEDALCVTLEQHNRSLLLCLYSMLDIMIHYDGASREDVAKLLDHFGIKNTAAVNAIYNYIADEPCNYLKYYLGYLEILELKKLAQSQWGESYSDYAFHCFLLDAGSSDFTALQERLAN